METRETKGAGAEVPPEVLEFISSRRVARLATADSEGAPHVVPVCYAYDGLNVYTAVDLKPKRVAPDRLRRIRNIVENPQVALIVDDYSEDWSLLAYVLVRGHASIMDGGDDQQYAERMLRSKYPQYERLLKKGCPIIKITPGRVVWWGKGLGRA